jgi:hypothetical protein
VGALPPEKLLPWHDPHDLSWERTKPARAVGVISSEVGALAPPQLVTASVIVKVKVAKVKYLALVITVKVLPRKGRKTETKVLSSFNSSDRRHQNIEKESSLPAVWTGVRI